MGEFLSNEAVREAGRDRVHDSAERAGLVAEVVTERDQLAAGGASKTGPLAYDTDYVASYVTSR